MKRMVLGEISDEYWIYYDEASRLAEAFPHQDAHDFVMAIRYNSPPEFPDGTVIADIKMVKRGVNAAGSWIWNVTTDEHQYVVTGWCDYTGWDGQSGVDVEKVELEYKQGSNEKVRLTVELSHNMLVNWLNSPGVREECEREILKEVARAVTEELQRGFRRNLPA